jgi:YqaJ-like viral recombinase domain
MALHPDRDGRLTASNIAVALGHGYDSPQAFWRQWNGMEEKQLSPTMQYGIDHEDDAVMEYEALMGDLVTHRQEWLYWEDWSGCTLDGRTQFGVLECKVPQKMYETPPVKHWIQVQAQMVFADEGIADLCAWTPEGSRIWRTKKHESLWINVEPIVKLYYECLTSGLEPRRGQFKKIPLEPIWDRVV